MQTDPRAICKLSWVSFADRTGRDVTLDYDDQREDGEDEGNNLNTVSGDDFEINNIIASKVTKRTPEGDLVLFSPE